MAQKRIQREMTNIRYIEPLICSIPMQWEDLFHWQIFIMGPDDSPFQEGVFALNIQYPKDYPFKPLKMNFITPIYHPNIDANGAICLCMLKTSGLRL